MRHAHIDDPHLERFLRNARNAPTFDREEELRLARLARKGDRRAREALLVANLRHVVSMALRHRRYGLPIADLVAEGCVGLCVAVDKFDEERGTRFVTYAGHWIRAYILEAVLKSRTLVGGGAGALRSKIYFRLQRERARLVTLTNSQDELVDRLAQSFGTSPAQMEGMLQRIDSRDVTLDAPSHDEEGPNLVERLASNEPDALDLLEARHRKLEEERVVREAIAALDPRERRIVAARAMEDDPASLAALGRELGVSRERARQLEDRAHRKLVRHISERSQLAA